MILLKIKCLLGMIIGIIQIKKLNGIMIIVISEMIMRSRIINKGDKLSGLKDNKDQSILYIIEYL